MRIFKWLSFALMMTLIGLAAGCSGDTTNNYAAGSITSISKGTLQGAVMNAVTGERIGGSDLKMFLIQGTEDRIPNKLITDTANVLVGEYAFTDIPITAGSDSTFKIVVVKAGYQRFESEFSYKATASTTEVFNKIGNIYLYPTSNSAPDYKFTITANGKPVSGATVLFQQNPTANTATALIAPNSTTIGAAPGGASSTRLFATSSLIPSLSATTTAEGTVTFSGTNLVLGGNYNLIVLPVSFESATFGKIADPNNPFVIGTTPVTDIIALTDIQQTTSNNFGLYVTSISNSVSGSINGSGQLIITFNRSVTVNKGATGFGLGVLPGGGLPAPVFAGTNPVTASLSTDGLTLTLSPNFTTAPASTSYDTSIQYSPGTATISPVGYPGSTFDVFSLLKANGAAISGAVKMIGTQP